ncbi:MAG: ATP synthase F1 subunit gamma [Clostridia bacterium]|nr:ATP synthase F1 subunit gamma [Clostridia bacterium]
MAGASMNDIKARIKSVNGTMQITKAMELVATSKLRLAKAKAEGSKPYMETLSEAMKTVFSFAADSESVFVKERDGGTLYVVIAGDRGLAGGYNSNVLKLSQSANDKNVIYLPIGKKARDYMQRRGYASLTDDEINVSDLNVGKCFNLAAMICEKFKAGEFTSLKLVYTKFISMLSQSATMLDLLPLESLSQTNRSEPIFEGDIDEIIDGIVPEYIGGILHAAVCEAMASECAARRTAMNSANKNAEEMIDSLTLKFNRARQAVITQEITEIVSGAEAL